MEIEWKLELQDCRKWPQPATIPMFCMQLPSGSHKVHKTAWKFQNIMRCNILLRLTFVAVIFNCKEHFFVLNVLDPPLMRLDSSALNQQHHNTLDAIALFEA